MPKLYFPQESPQTGLKQRLVCKHLTLKWLLGARVRCSKRNSQSKSAERCPSWSPLKKSNSLPARTPKEPSRRHLRTTVSEGNRKKMLSESPSFWSTIDSPVGMTYSNTGLSGLCWFKWHCSLWIGLGTAACGLDCLSKQPQSVMMLRVMARLTGCIW